MMNGFICSFSDGLYRVESPSGRTGLSFEDSKRFGPSKVNLRTGDLIEISERLRWFWDWYPKWIKAGKPTIGSPLSTPIGPVFTAQPSSGDSNA